MPTELRPRPPSDAEILIRSFIGTVLFLLAIGLLRLRMHKIARAVEGKPVAGWGPCDPSGGQC